MALELNAQPAKSANKPKRSLSEIQLFEQRPGVKERMFFTEQLVLLLETGTALHAALQLLKHLSGAVSGQNGGLLPSGTFKSERLGDLQMPLVNAGADTNDCIGRSCIDRLLDRFVPGTSISGHGDSVTFGR